jgi:hypothetical protein
VQALNIKCEPAALSGARQVEVRGGADRLRDEVEAALPQTHSGRGPYSPALTVAKLRAHSLLIARLRFQIGKRLCVPSCAAWG